MATTATENQSSSTTRSLYATLLGSEPPTPDEIRAATIELLEGVGQKPQPAQIRSFVNTLANIDRASLIQGFTVAAATSDFPKAKDVLSAITIQQFSSDWTWLLRNLKRHGVDWHDRDPVYKEWQRPTPDPMIVLEEAEPAPPIPPRIKLAIELYANGSVTKGLDLLSSHPNVRNYEEGGEEMRAKRTIDEQFRAAWMQARMRELGA